MYVVLSGTFLKATQFTQLKSIIREGAFFLSFFLTFLRLFGCERFLGPLEKLTWVDKGLNPSLTSNYTYYISIAIVAVALILSDHTCQDIF